jgi:hypothetical protein
MMPEPKQVARLLEAQLERSDEELSREARSNPQREQWQTECNLRLRLDELNS